MIEGTLWILLSLVLLGLLSWIVTQRQNKNRQERIARGEEAAEQPEVGRSDPECCGMHIICEKDSLLAAVSKEIVYYDDEELDLYKGREADEYSIEEVEEFRDVLLTLQEDDVPGWLRSLQLRNVALPEDLLPDALLIVGEHRVQHRHDMV
ncbi:with phospholipase A2 [Porphyromonas macacae]|uniref:With phospholipase A2 n=1 Tax=Porphyromonas macacae TaxID=28115 RepID=A0A379E6Z7_9PORP|nr:with phospholipase A2 [Porphyromonas macacae]KGN99246.1 with phospholipase A2 [Porphyromonas macacae]SUB88483.1 Uncharacterised protein [Porphyromonas macacae]